MNKPVLFCYDGSDGSRTALFAAGELVTHPADAVVLAVWMPAVVSLVRAGSFLTAVPNEGDIDEQEAALRNESLRRVPRAPASTATTPRHESRKPTSQSPRRLPRQLERSTLD